MGKGYLIDTCAVIKFLHSVFPLEGLSFLKSVVDRESILSVITKIELLVYKFHTEKEEDIVSLFIFHSRIINLEEDIIINTIRIRKEYSIKLPDAIIAATAITNDLVLISDNDKDFNKIPDLKYLNPKKI